MGKIIYREVFLIAITSSLVEKFVVFMRVVV